jgi:hypothetical protein
VLWFWTHFRGSSACPPTILLKPNSAGFSDPRGFKPIIATAAGFNMSASGPWWKGDIDANCNFYTQLHNLKIQIGKGNTGATGVIWRVAQQTSIRNLTVDATEGAVGLDVGSPAGYSQFGSLSPGGGGTVENVAIKGGMYGMRASASQWLLRNIQIKDSTVACMQISPWIFSLLSVHVANCPVGIEVKVLSLATNTSTYIFLNKLAPVLPAIIAIRARATSSWWIRPSQIWRMGVVLPL